MLAPRPLQNPGYFTITRPSLLVIMGFFFFYYIIYSFILSAPDSQHQVLLLPLQWPPSEEIIFKNFDFLKSYSKFPIFSNFFSKFDSFFKIQALPRSTPVERVWINSETNTNCTRLLYRIQPKWFYETFYNAWTHTLHLIYSHSPWFLFSFFL